MRFILLLFLVLGRSRRTCRLCTESIECVLLCVVNAGKTLQDESKTLSGLGMKQESKLILLGRKVMSHPTTLV